MALPTFSNFEDQKNFILTHLIQDTSHNEDFVYALLGQADIMLASYHPWSVLATKDTSITINGSTTWQTQKTFPSSTILYPQTVFTLASDSVTRQEYRGGEFSEQLYLKDEPYRYFIDWKNGYIHFTGTVSDTKTVYIFGNGYPTAPAAASTPSWDARFRALPCYLAARILAASDADDVMLSKALPFSNEFSTMLKTMKLIESSRKRASMGGRYGQTRRGLLIGGDGGYAPVSRGFN